MYIVIHEYIGFPFHRPAHIRYQWGNALRSSTSLSPSVKAMESGQHELELHVHVICYAEWMYGGCANAIPPYQKLRTRVSHVWGDRKLQLGEVQCLSLHLREPPVWSRYPLCQVSCLHGARLGFYASGWKKHLWVLYIAIFIAYVNPTQPYARLTHVHVHWLIIVPRLSRGDKPESEAKAS